MLEIVIYSSQVEGMLNSHITFCCYGISNKKSIRDKKLNVFARERTLLLDVFRVG